MTGTERDVETVRVGLWIAEDGSGDLFFADDPIAKTFTKERVILPLHGRLVEPPLWRSFVEQQIRQWEEFDAREREQGRTVPPRTPLLFYSRRFIRQARIEHVQTQEWPLYLDIDEGAERKRLARWKVLCKIGRERLLCSLCREGTLCPDGERLRCVRCEHGPSDWQRTGVDRTGEEWKPGGRP